MRRAQTKQRWWTTPLILFLMCVMMFAAIPVGAYVYERLSAWAAICTWLALIIGALASIGYFWPKVNGWLVLAIDAFVCGFCLFVSLSEGWQTQIQIAVSIGKIALFVGSVVVVVATIFVTRRFNHSAASIMRDIGEERRTDYLFRDDGERIIVYANRPRLLRQVIFQVIFIFALIGSLRWLLSNDPNPLALLSAGILLGLGVLFAFLSSTRLLMRGPTLVIGPDGILDLSTCIVTGRGLVRWDEILAVFQMAQTSSGITRRKLTITVTDAEAISKRQPLWKRPLVWIFRGQVPFVLEIPQSLLDRPPDALEKEIERYIELHAPPDWLNSPNEDDSEEDAVENDESQAI